MIVSKQFRFEASHQLNGYEGKCARLHGHSWILNVVVEGMINPKTGMVYDYVDLKSAIQPIVDRLDHQHLGFGTVQGVLLRNTVEGLPSDFLPTSENLLWWIATQIPLSLNWHCLELSETCTCNAVLLREEYERAITMETCLNKTVRKEATMATKKSAKKDKKMPKNKKSAKEVK
jgi:6-pyruvoyltetrahydropterin/6-carboxytetrahydropterin synthase